MCSYVTCGAPVAPPCMPLCACAACVGGPACVPSLTGIPRCFAAPQAKLPAANCAGWSRGGRVWLRVCLAARPTSAHARTVLAPARRPLSVLPPPGHRVFPQYRRRVLQPSGSASPERYDSPARALSRGRRQAGTARTAAYRGGRASMASAIGCIALATAAFDGSMGMAPGRARTAQFEQYAQMPQPGPGSKSSNAREVGARAGAIWPRYRT